VTEKNKLFTVRGEQYVLWRLRTDVQMGCGVHLTDLSLPTAIT